MIDDHQLSGRKVGVLFVGLCGATASTAVAGATAIQLGLTREQYGATDLLPFAQLDLIGASDMVFGGWDFRKMSLSDAVREHAIIPATWQTQMRKHLDLLVPERGLRSPLDIPDETTHDNVIDFVSLRDGIDHARSYIQRFKEEHKPSRLIVMYLGSPHKRGKVRLAGLSAAELAGNASDRWAGELPSGLAYALAAISAGADFVDFTPSETLETQGLYELASERRVQLAGRDGSTGQTMLKLTIAQMLKIRNLHLKSWFSTNILGNHDGRVLQLPGYGDTKLHDKMCVLAPMLGYDDFEHLVNIHYFAQRGDWKESWDVLDFEGWLGTKMSLRLNWYGEDSMLAGPLLMDIIRLVEFGARHNLGGLQPQFALFFKHPLGRLGTSLQDQFNEAASFYVRLGDRGSQR